MPSGPVILDPQEIRDFARRLQMFNSDLASSAIQLQGQFNRLGDTWRDPAYAKFAQEFSQTMRNLERFSRIADEVVPRLFKTAERADEVHRGA
jgi:uncharacterized protein YukE